MLGATGKRGKPHRRLRPNRASRKLHRPEALPWSRIGFEGQAFEFVW